MSSELKIDIIAGARPNFMKIGPIIHAINHKNKDSTKQITYRLIHTGQHYDKAMSESCFEQLNIPEPDINLGAGGGTQAEQTAAIMIGYEQALAKWKPDICMVVGDVTSTMACAVVAKKEHIRVAHVEAGIRSGDLTMPEEINRLVTDSITDLFFTTSTTANDNLVSSGVDKSAIHFVGNTMIDSLKSNLSRIIKPEIYDKVGLEEGAYIVATLHRPSNVDDIENLDKLLTIINDTVSSSGNQKVIFPMHPRTQMKFKEIGKEFDRIHIAPPMPYLEFLYLIKNSLGVVTDSGGITEETTVLGVPCITLRDNTERPETVEIGTNELVGTEPKNIVEYLKKMLNGVWKRGAIPQKWDGKTSDRIVEVLLLL